ncbi:MAG: hypothetical protein IPK31_22055 [Chitinophagaceae bacterium]|nr:hypothetical protein [Chitinophagaceae bacterium]
MKKINFIAVILIAILMSCTTTKITSTWKANNVVPKHYNKILVLGLIRDADRSLQEKMETHLVNDLKDMGYNAVSSLSEYGPKAFADMEEAAAISKLKKAELKR